MSAPLDALHANRHFARKRRVELLRAGGLAPGVADFYTAVTGAGIAPGLIAGDYLADSTIVSRIVGFGR